MRHPGHPNGTHDKWKYLLYGWVIFSAIVVLVAGFAALNEYENQEQPAEHSYGYYAVNQMDDVIKLISRFMNASERNFNQR